MKRFLVVAFLALAAMAVTSPQASAGNPAGLGFLPFGFYQPYGSQFGTSIRTPPYFTTNPPVYYGARHARPYGISPFASPPMVQPNEGYRSRLRTNFMVPPRQPTAPLCNSCVSHSKTFKKPAVEQKFVLGQIRENPFVEPSERIAQK
jgi:hypothetical protein